MARLRNSNQGRQAVIRRAVTSLETKFRNLGINATVGVGHKCLVVDMPRSQWGICPPKWHGINVQLWENIEKASNP